MNDDRNKAIALFRLAVLGDLVHAEPRRGELRRVLERKSQEVWRDVDGRLQRIAAKTIQSRLYVHKKEGLTGCFRGDARTAGSAGRSRPSFKR